MALSSFDPQMICIHKILNLRRFLSAKISFFLLLQESVCYILAKIKDGFIRRLHSRHNSISRLVTAIGHVYYRLKYLLLSISLRNLFEIMYIAFQ